MNLTIKILFFVFSTLLLIRCNGNEEKRLKQSSDSLISDNSGINKHSIDGVSTRNKNEIIQPPNRNNTTIVFPNFKVIFYQYKVKPPEFDNNDELAPFEKKNFDYEIINGVSTFIMKKDSIFLTGEFGDYLSYSEIEINSKQNNDTYKISIALNHKVNELYYGKIEKYDEWVRNSFQWSGQTNYQEIQQISKNHFSYYNINSDSIYLNQKEKNYLKLRDTSVTLSQIIDTRKEYFKVNLVRNDGKLCGYSLYGAIMKIQRYLNGKLLENKYILIGFEDEY